jgi:sarcosine oxidase, subunit alpha
MRFRFDDVDYEGFAGDTLASALLANGVDVVCPSPLLGRPRGVMAAGSEEPCAFVEVRAPRFDPIAAATTVKLAEGLDAAGRAGVGQLPGAPAPRQRCEHRHAHVETLVVGGGDAGMAAAESAAGRDDRVVVVDEARPARDPPPGATVLTRATALGVYDDGYVVVHQQGGPLERLWHIRAERVILATGAHERPIAFADDDRPGVMLAGAVLRYLREFGVLAGDRVVIFTTNDSAYAVADAVRDAGAELVCVVDVRPEAPPQAAARARGIEVLAGWMVTGTDGSPRVSAVHVASGANRRSLGADLLAVSGGWNPVTQLWRAIGGGLAYDERLACFIPDGNGPRWLSVVGSAAGEGLPTCAPLWFVPADDLSRHFVDFQRDATVADVLGAVERGLRSVEHVKRATYIGTALDQGRTSGVLTAEVVNAQLGWDPGAQGPTNARPPFTPVSYAAVAGPYRGRMLDPERETPIHPWHVAHGAAFENVGQWKRPWYFPGPGEGLEDAVLRECRAVRTGVGVMDASTLGKIEVAGPDAGGFLDRMYTNLMSSLRPGSIRYGVVCGVDGMVLDDGVAMRLDEGRYLVTTTTGGAATVLDHFEEWLQTEWPQLRVYCTSVTEQWSTVSLAGPRAREVLAAAGTDVDLSAEAFPFMTLREGSVAGIPTRVARVSFSGELAYEINVAAWHAVAMWEAVLHAGDAIGIVPYGTEAMHVLRAEKGFPIVGQETDGTVTPHDLGMSWIVNERKGDFVGRRSLRRPALARPGRKQLVGVMPVDREALLPEGAQLLVEGSEPTPASGAGHVTSSYRSAALGRTFALAMVPGGRSLIGRTVRAPMPDGVIDATITDPVFYDADGTRRDG